MMGFLQFSLRFLNTKQVSVAMVVFTGVQRVRNRVRSFFLRTYRFKRGYQRSFSVILRKLFLVHTAFSHFTT